MHKISTKLCLALLLSLLAFGANAMSAEELEGIPSSAKCRREAMNLKPLFDRRDEGMSREQALGLIDATNGVPISRRAVQLAFDFPKMPRDGLTVYNLWACHALEHFVEIRSMGDFTKDFEECYAKAAWQREVCANVLWNRVHGLSDDHKSRAQPVVVTAPTVSRPGAAGQAEGAR
jgi:hypothetical protein